MNLKRFSYRFWEIISVTIIAILITVVVGFRVITRPGIPILAEQIESFDENNFIESVQVWDAGLSTTSIADLPKIYMYYLVYFLSKLFGFEIIIKLFLILPHSIAFLTSYYFIRKYYFNSGEISLLTFIALIAISMTYAFNPWIAHRSRNLILRWQYALIPVLVYLWIRVLKSEKYQKSSFIFAVILTLIETTRFIFKIIIPLILLTLFYSILNKEKVRIAFLFKKIVMTLSIVVSLIAPVYLPLLYITLTQSPTVIQQFTVELISGEKSINSFALYVTDYPGRGFTCPYPPDDKKPFAFLFVPVLSLSSILLIKSRRSKEYWFTLCILVLLIMTLYFTMLKEAPLSTLVIYIFQKLPTIGRIYRQSYHNVMFLPFYYIALLGFLYSYLSSISKDRKHKILILATSMGLILSSMTSSWVLLTGDLNGYWRPSIVPRDYVYVNEMIVNESGTRAYHALWLPVFGGKKAIWINATSPYDGPPTGIFALRSSFLPTYLYMNIYFFDYYNPIGTRPLYRLLECYPGKNWGNILAPLGIKYLIIHYDVKGENLTHLRQLVNRLRNDASLSLLYQGKYLAGFAIKQASPPFYVNNVAITSKGLLTHASLLNYLRNITLIYLEQKLISYHVLYNADYIIPDFENIYSYLLTTILKFGHPVFLQPNRYVQRIVNPSNSWAYSYSVSDYSFQRHLYFKGIINWAWQYDYGYGLVFTWATKKIPKNIVPKEEDLVRCWSFDSMNDFLEWRRFALEKQFGSLQRLEWANGALKAVLYNSTWGWKSIVSPPIPARFGEIFRFYLRVKGENAWGVHVKVFEYDSRGKLLGGKYVKGVGSGTFGWRAITFDYVVQNPNTSYIQLQIFYGYRSGSTLPSVVWIDDVKVYNITRYTRPVILDIPFKVRKSGYYKLFIRYFESQRGGMVIVKLDGNSILVNTRSQLNRFVWRDLGTFFLKAGKHRIVLENGYGFNAVNLFVLIPEEEYYKAMKELKRLLQNKMIIYIFEAESDMFRSRALVGNSVNASNGEMVELDAGGAAWQSFRVIKPGYYMVGVRLYGDAIVRLDGNVFNLSSSSLGFKYVGPMYLGEGVHSIRIEPLVKNLVSLNFSKGSYTYLEEVAGQDECGHMVSWDSFMHAVRIDLYNYTSCPHGLWLMNLPLVSAKHDHVYVFRFLLKTINCRNIALRVTEYSRGGEVLHTSEVEGLYTNASSGWSGLEYYYVPEDRHAAYIKSQLICSHLVNASLPATVWIRSIRVYQYKPLYLDVVWIYSVNSSSSKRTLEDLFMAGGRPAEVTSYERVNPTLWRANVTARKPFILVFAESYDPLWEARVYKSGKLVERVRPVPVYGVINGFWINETGNLTIVIRYVPQDWFDLGLKISATTFALCVFYLVWDWRRGRGDRWALRLEGVLRGLGEGLAGLARRVVGV